MDNKKIIEILDHAYNHGLSNNSIGWVYINCRNQDTAAMVHYMLKKYSAVSNRYLRQFEKDFCNADKKTKLPD